MFTIVGVIFGCFIYTAQKFCTQAVHKSEVSLYYGNRDKGRYNSGVCWWQVLLNTWRAYFIGRWIPCSFCSWLSVLSLRCRWTPPVARGMRCPSLRRSISSQSSKRSKNDFLYQNARVSGLGCEWIVMGIRSVKCKCWKDVCSNMNGRSHGTTKNNSCIHITPTRAYNKHLHWIPLATSSVLRAL